MEIVGLIGMIKERKMRSGNKTANYKCTSDSGGIRYSFYCDISHAIVCSTEPIQRQTIEEGLEYAWKTIGERHFNRCKKCGKWVIDAMYNPEMLECVICSPWETDAAIGNEQVAMRIEFGFGPDAMKKKKVCRRCKYICNTEGNFCHICGSVLPDKTLFDIYGQQRDRKRNERGKGLWDYLTQSKIKSHLN